MAKKRMKCDVLVVGAGPAGSSAARAAAEAGAKTIFIDKKKEIGVPVQCGEGVGKFLFPYLPFKVPREQLIWELDGVCFWADDITIERTGGIWSSYAINRKKFDKWLSNNSVDAGARLFTNAELVGLEVKEGYEVRKAMIKTAKGEIVIEPKVVIAADGVDSTVLKLLGFEIDKKAKCGEVLSFEMENLKIDKPHRFQVFLGEFAPGAYAYILPKSKTTANVGIGTVFAEKNIEKYYEEFMEIPYVKKQVKEGINVEEKSGWAPIFPVTDKWVFGNVMLAGDAANQNFKPLVEGILPGVICGHLAGKSAYNFVVDDVPLSGYQKHVNNKLGRLFAESDQITDISYELALSQCEGKNSLCLGLFSNIFSFKQIEKLRNEEYNKIKGKLEGWNNSKIKQVSTVISEKIGLLWGV
jgi:digeranylgeranylglycerophospholipid reductase